MRIPRRLFRLASFVFVALVVLGASLALPSALSSSPQVNSLAVGAHPVLASAPRINCDPNTQTWATGMNGAAGQCLTIAGDVATCLYSGGIPAIYPGNVFVCGGVQPPPPPPNPDKPGVDLGAACMAGSTRVVKLSPGNNSGGATFTVRMATAQTEGSGPYTTQSGPGTSYTYSGLAQDVAYVFQAQATTNNGSSGWTGWVGPVKQDLNPPTTTYTPVGTAGTNGWWKSNVMVSLPAVDSGCLGVKSTTYTLDSNPPATYTGTPFPVTGDGIHTLSFFSTDGAHVETTQTVTIKIDTTPPTLTMTPSRPPDTTYGWWHSTPTITLAVSDATSGVASTVIQIDGGAWTAWNGKTITFQGDLKHTLNVTVTDNAGNVTTNGWVFPVDSTPPQVGLNYDKGHGPNGWFTSSPVEVYLTTSDNLSGIALTMIRVDGGPMDSSRVSVVGDGVHIVAWFVYDKAGNQNVSMLPVQIDTTPPDVGSVSCGPSSIAPGQSWSLSASVGDNASGVQTLTMNVNGAESGSASTGFPAGTLSTNATLSYTPNTLGTYSVDLTLTDWAQHVTTRGSVCSFSVTQPIFSSAVRKPTKTLAPNLIYKIVTNTPTVTATGTQSVQPAGTMPPTGTAQAAGQDSASAGSFNSGAGGSRPVMVTPTATNTPTSTPAAVAMLLPGGNGTSGGGGGRPGILDAVLPPPDLNTLLGQAGLLAMTGSVIATSAWALARKKEEDKQKIAQQEALKLALLQQSQAAQTDYQHNQDLQAAAAREVAIASAPSDAWVKYLAALDGYYKDIAFRKGEVVAAEQYWAEQALLEKERELEARRQAALEAYYAQQEDIRKKRALRAAMRKDAQLEAADAGVPFTRQTVYDIQQADAQGESLGQYMDELYQKEDLIHQIYATGGRDRPHPDDTIEQLKAKLADAKRQQSTVAAHMNAQIGKDVTAFQGNEPIPALLAAQQNIDLLHQQYTQTVKALYGDSYAIQANNLLDLQQLITAGQQQKAALQAALTRLGVTPSQSASISELQNQLFAQARQSVQAQEDVQKTAATPPPVAVPAQNTPDRNSIFISVPGMKAQAKGPTAPVAGPPAPPDKANPNSVFYVPYTPPPPPQPALASPPWYTGILEALANLSYGAGDVSRKVVDAGVESVAKGAAYTVGSVQAAMMGFPSGISADERTLMGAQTLGRAVASADHTIQTAEVVASAIVHDPTIGRQMAIASATGVLNWIGDFNQRVDTFKGRLANGQIGPILGDAAVTVLGALDGIAQGTGISWVFDQVTTVAYNLGETFISGFHDHPYLFYDNWGKPRQIVTGYLDDWQMAHLGENIRERDNYKGASTVTNVISTVATLYHAVTAIPTVLSHLSEFVGALPAAFREVGAAADQMGGFVGNSGNFVAQGANGINTVISNAGALAREGAFVGVPLNGLAQVGQGMASLGGNISQMSASDPDSKLNVPKQPRRPGLPERADLGWERGQLTDNEFEFFRSKAQKWNKRIVLSGSLSETDLGLMNRYNPDLREYLPDFRRNKWWSELVGGPDLTGSEAPDVDLWEGSDLTKSQVQSIRDYFKEIDSEIKVGDKGYKINYPNEPGSGYKSVEDFAKKGGAIIFEPDGTTLRVPAPWQLPDWPFTKKP